MIIYNTRSAVRVLCHFRGTVIPAVWLRVLCCSALSVLVSLLAYYNVVNLGVNAQAHTLISVVLGLILTFRTNFCNERWNEGRRSLGQLHISLRAFVRLALAHTPLTLEHLRKRDALRRYAAALFVAAKQHVRDEFSAAEYDSLLSDSELAQLQIVHNRPQVNGAMDALGQMERIASTPTVFAYAHHIKLFLFLYCCTLPFALVPTMSYIAPAAVCVISYALFGIDEIGAEIEEPFGQDYNDLPFDDMQRRMQADADESARADTLARTLPPDPQPWTGPSTAPAPPLSSVNSETALLARVDVRV